ncbi:MAG TPA: hypothetical protein VLZ10_17505 [Thermodesulfobacteriota bacterium]|nr:hypothetical protein [Thermodesulfobacteriota bacterium]
MTETWSFTTLFGVRVPHMNGGKITVTEGTKTEKETDGDVRIHRRMSGVQ